MDDSRDRNEPEEAVGHRPDAAHEREDATTVKVVDRRWWARQDQGTSETGEMPSTKPTYVEELERQLGEKDTLLQGYIAKYREAAGEFEQARARLRREIAKEVERGRRTLLVELLEVVDNLDRALEAGRDAGPGGDALLQGVAMVRDQFLAKLAGFGVSRLAPLNAPFDPLRHEAVTTVPVSDPEQDGLVVGVAKPGYLIGDEVLRPALVAVARVEVESRTDAGST